MKYSINALVLILMLLFVSSCDKTDPEIDNEEEVITTITYTLTSTSGDIVSMKFEDLDGDGGNAPTITGGTLAANTTYAGTLELLNETETPAGNITKEIEEEDEDHQFFFQTDIAGLTVSYNDQDSNQDPIGLATTLTTGEAASGTMTLVLRHMPNKGGDGVSTGDITNAGGTTDAEVIFPVDVQ